MWLNKRDENAARAAGSAVTAAVVEPFAGKSDVEVVRLLEANGASRVEVLAPGHISAEATVDAFDAVAHMAHVHVKARKSIR